MNKRSEEIVLHKLDIDHVMSQHFLTMSARTKVKSVAKRIYTYMKNHEDAVPSVYIVDTQKRLLGEVSLISLIHSHKDEVVGELMHNTQSVPDRISKIRLLKQAVHTRKDRIVVVDDAQRPIGVIHTHDLIDLAMREAQGKALGLFAGAHQNERATDSPFTAVKLRYKWLILNLGTALLATFTVSFFSDTLSQMVILAAYMPLVAGMGGNAGAQAVSVMVRGIALGEVHKQNASIARSHVPDKFDTRVNQTCGESSGSPRPFSSASAQEGRLLEPVISLPDRTCRIRHLLLCALRIVT